MFDMPLWKVGPRVGSVGVLLAGLVLHALATGGAASASASWQAGGQADLPLWEVTHGASTVYLLGSIHMLPPDAYPLDDALYDAFDAADVVAFELDFAETAAAAPTMMARGMFGDGRTLRSELPADLYADLDRRFTELGVPVEMVDPMKPWLVGLTLTALATQQAGYQAEWGIDLHFYERAQRAGKAVVAFETVEDQIEVFDGLAPADQAAFLRSTLDEIDLATDRMDEMAGYWRTGQAERLAELLSETLGDQPALRERILFERNRNWVPRIEALLEVPGTSIVIVGMGHMVGPGSVVQLLRDRGYEVARVARTAASR